MDSSKYSYTRGLLSRGSALLMRNQRRTRVLLHGVRSLFIASHVGWNTLAHHRLAQRTSAGNWQERRDSQNSLYYSIASQEHRMDFITGALPNVMFIAGLIAMGIGLGIEFKIVEIKGELSKQGRIGAIGIGAVLVLVSVYLYTRPPQTASQPAPTTGPAPGVVQANAGAPQAVSQPAPTQAAQAQVVATPIPPSATAVPPSATTVPPSATPLPTSTATSVPPTKTSVPTATPSVKVPDIREHDLKDAQQTLAKAGLRLGEARERCEDIGASETGRKLKKGQVSCQSPAPGSMAAPNTPVQFVLVGGSKGDD
jgi:PASTA domain